MEFLEGKSLREIIDSGVVLAPEKIAEIVAQVADGLACAHKNHVIHRDIKPANIMLLDSGTVKITDFGIALLSQGIAHAGLGVWFSEIHLTGASRRTACGRAIGYFSLGAVLYELLTGSWAFTAKRP